ncbi:hypothetical protein [Streptomyces sp. NBC_01304]|uniref:hypothetical protein n=1 Tax=Streptomyces sp. NBC_01304 TaxID=2903818 RepID=UPI002E12BD57|nr:hypothetical protein OG430_05260 [Streptomyces sp. NBC_01304]
MNALALLALGLADAAFAGFRAYAGRDGRIRKGRAALLAARRGLATGVPGLVLTAAVAAGLLLGAGDRAERYATLDDAAGRMLLVYAPYTAVVLASLCCYFWGNFRISTLAVVIGLGPLTLLRPLVVLAGAVAAARGSLPGAVVATVASAAVLLVEPVVHRRWYAVPL